MNQPIVLRYLHFVMVQTCTYIYIQAINLPDVICIQVDSNISVFLHISVFKQLVSKKLTKSNLSADSFQ